VVNRHAADVLAEHDLSLRRRIVINTHLHFDHCGQNAVFSTRRSTSSAQAERARREEASRPNGSISPARASSRHGDAQVADGVRVVATPGHTVGHQSVLVARPTAMR
jgi:glyoxylase-like metal-dependent hydrolase (beta-lactamase superfamily II)